MSITQEEFQKEFGDMMLHGLNSFSTYIPLRVNKSMGINVAIRPFVIRVSNDVILYNTKLRVGYTLDEHNKPLEKSVIDISEDVAAAHLKNFCKGFTWQKSDGRRFSTVIGFAVAASKYDGEQAAIVLEENNLAEKFISTLEAKYKQYNDVGFTSKRKVIQALNATWNFQIQSGAVFSVLPLTTQLPDAIIGLQSGVLNKAQKGYDGNVVSFQKKVAELAAAAEKTATEETTASD